MKAATYNKQKNWYKVSWSLWFVLSIYSLFLYITTGYHW